MRQTLVFIPHEIEALGLPVFGGGVALIVWLVICAIWLGVLVRRHGWTNESLGIVPLAVIVAAVIYFVLPQIEEGPADAKLGVPIRGYGVMLLIAVVTGVGLATYRARQMGLESEVIYSLAFWMFVAGIAGARLFFVLQYNDQFLVENADGAIDWTATGRAMLNVTQGGLVVYGSLIGGAVAYAAFVYRRNLTPLGLADIIAPSMLIGLAIGRIGCLLNGCCFGGVCYADLPAITFPAANPPYQNEPSPPYARQLQLGQLHGFTLAGKADNATETDNDNGGSEEDKKDKVPMVVQLKPGGPAERAGLKVGAIVQRINGKAIVQQQINGKWTTSFESAQLALYTSGPAIDLETDQGSVTIDIGSFPPRSDPVHPAQIYSAINGFVLFLFLWLYYPFRRHDGEVFAALLSIYPVTRVILEWVRIDESGRFGTALTISQWISIGLLLAACVLWAYILRQKSETWPQVAPAA